MMRRFLAILGLTAGQYSDYGSLDDLGFDDLGLGNYGFGDYGQELQKIYIFRDLKAEKLFNPG